MHTILWTSYHYTKNSQFKHLTDLRPSQHSTQVPWPVRSFNLVLFSNLLCNTVSVTWDCTGWGKQKSLVCKYDFYMVFLTFYRIIKSHSTSAQNVCSRKVNLHAITSTWSSASITSHQSQWVNRLLRCQPNGRGSRGVWVWSYTFEVLSSSNRSKKSKENPRTVTWGCFSPSAPNWVDSSTYEPDTSRGSTLAWAAQVTT